MNWKRGLTALVACTCFAVWPVFASTDGTLLAARPPAGGAARTPDPAAPKVLVRQFKFAGNTVYSEEVLSRLTSGKVGKEMSLQDLQDLAALVTDLYQKDGYFLAKTVVPEQDIQGGVVTLRILEGRLGEIIITGARRYPDAYVRKAFDRVRDEKVIRQQTLERALLILNDISGIEVSSVLQAGKEVGTTDIAVKVVEKEHPEGSMEFNNFGTRLSSRYRFITSVNFNNVSGHGDALDLRLVSAPNPRDVFFGRFYYSRPVNANGTKLSAYLVGGDFEVGEEFASLNITGEGLSWGLGVSHPLTKTRKKSLTFETNLEWNDSEQFLLGALSSADRIRKVRTGLSLDTRDNSGRNFLSFQVHQGLGELMGGMRSGSLFSSRAFSGADNRFTKFTLDLARVQRLTPRFYMIGRGSVQQTTRPLVVGEQISIGGADTVRGYPQSAFLGDSGFNLSLEGRFSPWGKKENIDRFQIAAFVDHGTVSNRRPTPGQSKQQNITGAGFGFRASMPHEFSLRADLGFNAGSAPSSGSSPATYFSLMKRF